MSEDDARERDLDVARMRLGEAMDALEERDLLEVLDAVGSVTTWIAKASLREESVATVRVIRAGNAQPEYREVHPGETETLEIHGKATVEIEGEDVGLHGEVVPDG